MKGNRTIVQGRFMVSICRQAGGAPLVDRCWTRETVPPYRSAKGIVIYLAFWRMLRRRVNRPPGRGLMIARIEHEAVAMIEEAVKQ